jgi:hypothetical protein
MSTPPRLFSIFVLLCLGCLTGCARGGDSASAYTSAPAASAPASAQLAASTEGAAVPDPARRIIYTAEIALTVADITGWQRELDRLVAIHRAYLSGNDFGGEPGSARTGVWQVRVPVASFQDFLAAVQKAGEVQRVKTDSQDVSEEYVDADSRLKNQRVEEQRLLGHLQHSTTQLGDILTVEKEINRVRQEIERIEGRLRYLRNRTEYTTVTLRVEERKTFQPSNPTFAALIGRTWGQSLAGLAAVGQGMVLFLVAVVPWLLVAALLAFPTWRLFRRLARP